MKYTSKQINECKKNIMTYQNAKTERMYKIFKRVGYGRIIIENDEKVENIVYEGVSRLLHLRYGSIIDKNELYTRISKYGKIYTMDMKEKNGFYDENTASIGINHFLNKLTNTLLHEIVHKAGKLSFSESFYNLPNVYKEAGAEIISSETLKTKYCREYIYNGNWARFPNTLQSRFLLCSLVNQLSIAIGENEFVDTIVNGTNSFEKKSEEILGKDKFKEYTQKLENIVNIEKKYWKKDIDDENARKATEEKLNGLVDEWQNNLLKDVFGKKEIFLYEDANEYLKKLKEFSELRIKKENKNYEFSDTFFKDFFNNAKEKIEKMFPNDKFEVEYSEKEWSEKYKCNTIDERNLSDKEVLAKMESVYEKTSFLKKVLNKNNSKKVKMLDEKSKSDFDERLKINLEKISIQNYAEREKEERVK